MLPSARRPELLTSEHLLPPGPPTSADGAAGDAWGPVDPTPTFQGHAAKRESQPVSSPGTLRPKPQPGDLSVRPLSHCPPPLWSPGPPSPFQGWPCPRGPSWTRPPAAGLPAQTRAKWPAMSLRVFPRTCSWRCKIQFAPNASSGSPRGLAGPQPLRKADEAATAQASGGGGVGGGSVHTHLSPLPTPQWCRLSGPWRRKS